MSKNFIFSRHFLNLLSAGLVFFSTFAQAEWNEAWTNRQKVTLNVQGVTETVNNASLLIRLHSGNFDFTSANIDGSDIRLIAADDKTELPYYIEKYDAVNELAVIWVKIPQISQNIKDNYFWLYSGNEGATSNGSAKAVLDDHTVGLFPFKEDALLKDISNTSALATGTIAANTSGFIGSSATFSGQAMTIPTNPAYSQANGFTFSMWIKPASLPQTAVLWREGDQLTLRLDGQNLKLSLAGEEIAGPEIKAAVWQHVAVTWQSGKASLFVNGVEVASGQANLSDANSDIVIGDAYSGEMDELELDNVARTGSWVHVIFASQGVEGKWLTVAPPSGEGDEDEGGEANYIGILIENLTIDAKVVIAILAVMFFISAWVMWSKAVLVSKTDKDNKRFLSRFQKADVNDLLALDKGAVYPNSTLFGLYQAGLREIKKREHPEQTLALSGASMDAIKAAIDADLVRETQRLNNLMVLLTIAISGGPFLGLLGTVVGVMITFAAIAAAGDVNVNAIAPGIAAALLATVAGLGVAIPALFGYNYLASRIKNITIAMQIFVDEFVTRTAELFGKE